MATLLSPFPIHLSNDFFHCAYIELEDDYISVALS
jgi:hypothetical protein